MRWIRIWTTETLQSTTFQELNPFERGIWFSLLVMAGANIRNQGIVEIRDNVPYSIPTLAEFLACETSELQQSLHKLQSVNKIKLNPDGRIEIVNWSKYQTEYERYKKGLDKDLDKGLDKGLDKKLDTHPRQKKKEKKKEKKTLLREKTPTKEMFTFFSNLWCKKHSGSPLLSARDGRQAKLIWRQCRKDNPDNPMAEFEKRCALIMQEYNLDNFSALISWWNSGAKRAKRTGWDK